MNLALFLLTVVMPASLIASLIEMFRARRSEKLGNEVIDEIAGVYQSVQSENSVLLRQNSELQKAETSLRSEIKHQQELNTRLNADWTATSAALANEQAKTVQLQESIRTLGLQVETRDDTIEKLTAEVAELRDAKQAIVASRWSDDGCGD